MVCLTLFEQVEIDLDDRDLLIDVVVQLARDVRALGFLSGKQSAAEVADPLVARTQLSLTLPNPLLGFSSPCALNEKAND